MDPPAYKSRGALSAQDALQTALIRAARVFRRSLRKAVVLWLCVTSSLANCVILADEPTFFGVPYGPRCEERCGVCPSAMASRCVPIHVMPLANIQLVADPTSAERWNLTIHEAVQIALANSQVVRNLGLQQEQSSDIDKIRAVITRYDPLAAAATADAEWGIFDPILTTTMNWDHQDIPPGTSFGGIGARPPRLDTADFDTSISQLLPTGGEFRADWVTQYLLNPDHPVNLVPNPQYFSYQQFGITQPLCQGRGAEVTMAPIRIASAKAEQTDWRFKQEILALVRSVETAYWELYAQQQNLKVIDEVLPMFRETVRIREQQSQANAGTETEVAQAKADMYLYEQRRLETLSLIAEQQLVIRNLLGLSLDDNRYMWLVALPAKTPPFESLEDAVATAINRRPDILRQRLAVYVAQQQTIVAGDKMRPHLDFNAFWRINGLGEDVGSSIDSVADDQYTDWHIGVGFQIPLGRRQARGNLRAAQFTIEKQQALLDQVAHQSSYEVADAYRRAIWLSQQQKVVEARVGALNQWRVGAKAQFENPPAGLTTTNALQLYLQNLRDLVDASAQSNAILANFNNALVRLEEVKGTLLESELVQVEGDGTDQLPPGLPTPQLQVPDSVLPAPVPSQPAPETAPPVPKPAPQPAPAPKPTTPPADSGQGASIDSHKSISPAPSSGMMAKMAAAGRRAGKTLSPVGKRFAQPFHRSSADQESRLAGDQIMQQPSNVIRLPKAMQTTPAQVTSNQFVQQPNSVIQPPETIQTMPSQVAPMAYPRQTVADATPQLPIETPATPSDLPVAVSIPSAANVGEFHSILRPGPASTESVVALPAPGPSMQSDSIPLPTTEIAEITPLPPSPPRASESTMLAQPTELTPTPDGPAQEANRPQIASLPRSKGTNSLIQQPESFLPPSVPTGRVYPLARPSTQLAAAAPGRVSLPDMIVPVKPQEADTASVRRPSSTQHARVSDRISPDGSLQMPDSMLPPAISTASRPLGQPALVR